MTPYDNALAKSDDTVVTTAHRKPTREQAERAAPPMRPPMRPGWQRCACHWAGRAW